MPATRRRRWPWIVGAVLVVVLVPSAILAIPILTHQNAGLSNQEDTGEQWPLSVTAEGDDGRTRVLSVHAVEPGGTIDTSALEIGERLVVSGTGYDATQGIYVAICVIPDDPAVKPGPCIGGVPAQEVTEATVGAVEYAPSNWINDDWAWKLFGARSYDDLETGTFTAYLEVGDPVGEGFDCREQACGIYTRNDHTALGDRVQDVYIPVGFR
jgi:hypothetical protein